ncbi:MAG: polyphosphate kinase 2 [Pseudomonadota bacterium]
MRGKIGTRNLRKTPSTISREVYENSLHQLQIELVKLQRHFIKCNEKILVIFEGRDASGKDGTIKRIVQHLSPRETRVVALGKPSDRDRSSWYFQRYVPYLPVAQELVLFNRSWYNRAGVERVMGFCTEAEYKEFINSVPEFERMLVHSGIKLFKYYLDISKTEQKRRLDKRKSDPLTQWKISTLDSQALKKWKQYSLARDEMLAHTHSLTAPWTIVHADDKQLARLNIIKDMLSRLDYADKAKRLILPDPQIISTYDATQPKKGLLAP